MMRWHTWSRLEHLAKDCIRNPTTPLWAESRLLKKSKSVIFTKYVTAHIDGATILQVGSWLWTVKCGVDRLLLDRFLHSIFFSVSLALAGLFYHQCCFRFEINSLHELRQFNLTGESNKARQHLKSLRLRPFLMYWAILSRFKLSSSNSEL